MSACDAIAIPSTHEGFSLVAMEAMLLQKPVLAAAVGGLPELISSGDSGLLFPAEDPQALADAIARLVREPALGKRLSEASREHIIRLCGTDVVMRQWQSVFRPEGAGY